MIVYRRYNADSYADFTLISACFCVVISVISAVAPLAQAQAALPQIPIISVAPARFYPQDEQLYMEGLAEPGARVELFLEKLSGDAASLRLRIDVNQRGEWFYAEYLDISGGEWMVRARAISGEDSSDWSNPRIIRAVETGFSLLGITVKYAPLVLSIVIFLLLGAGMMIYSYIKVQHSRRMEMEHAAHDRLAAAQKIAREKEKESIELTAEKGFSEVRRDLMAELEHLNSMLKEKGELPSEEYEHRERLMRELSKLEEDIDKKVRDLDGV